MVETDPSLTMFELCKDWTEAFIRQSFENTTNRCIIFTFKISILHLLYIDRVISENYETNSQSQSSNVQSQSNNQSNNQ